MAKPPQGRLDDATRVVHHDHEIITPKHNLKRHATRVKDAPVHPEGIDHEAMERAERAMQALSSEFDGWMAKEVDRLTISNMEVQALGLSASNRPILFRIAHDIKGEAATFGYPLAGRAANTLCKLLELIPDPAQVPLPLISKHVEAIQAILREQVKGGGNKIGEQLVAVLRERTIEALARIVGPDALNDSEL
jgi:HPt (histidine-containing phosphotransfer) domain-containing protein